MIMRGNLLLKQIATRMNVFANKEKVYTIYEKKALGNLLPYVIIKNIYVFL